MTVLQIKIWLFHETRLWKNGYAQISNSFAVKFSLLFLGKKLVDIFQKFQLNTM